MLQQGLVNIITAFEENLLVARTMASSAWIEAISKHKSGIRSSPWTFTIP
jgi:hypothetical protein